MAADAARWVCAWWRPRVCKYSSPRDSHRERGVVIDEVPHRGPRVEIVRLQTRPPRSRHAPPPQDPPRSTQTVAVFSRNGTKAQRILRRAVASLRRCGRKTHNVFRHGLHLFALDRSEEHTSE